MSEQERQMRDKTAEHPETPGDQRVSGEAPPDPGRPESLMGRVGRAVSNFDETLSDRVPDAIEDASTRAADSARRGVQSGLWHNYAFLAVLALVAITLVVLLARGCAAGAAL